MTLPQPSGVVIHADTVYLGQPTTLDEHAEEARRVLITDREVDKMALELRRQLIEDLSDAEYFRDELRKVLRLSDEAAARYGDPDLVAMIGLNLQKGSIDWETVNRVTAVVENFPEDWSAEDLARAVRSALHPLSTSEAVVTAQMPAVTPAAESKAAETNGGEPAERGPAVVPAPAQPALTQLAVTSDLFRS